MLRQTRFPKLTLLAVLTLCPMLGAAAGVAADTGEEKLAKRVRHELVTLPYLSVFDHLVFRVEDGQVTLSGQVVRPTLKSSAENVVKRLEGVTQVVNRIEVLPLSPYDDRVRLAVLRSVYSQPSLQKYGLGALASIQIIVKNGEVTLEGLVNNEGDRNIAFLRANGVSGVFKVTNNLRVVRG